MTSTATSWNLPLTDRELAALTTSSVGEGARVAAVSASRYTTSFPLYELDVAGPAGGRRVVIKDLRWSALSEDGRRAKRRDEYDPSRELGVYREVLAGLDGPPAMLGGRGDRRSSSCWLAMEHVDGAELYQWGDRSAWEAAARWLGGLHDRWRGRCHALVGTRRRVPLLRHDRDHFAGLAARAAAGGDGDGRLADVLTAWSGASRDLLAVEPTLVHGECYSSNVIVTRTGRVAVVDWETAAVGSGWGDLAALVVGWPRADREALLEQYLRTSGQVPGDADPQRLLDAAQLQACVRWLGADAGWRPPSEHRRDWLGDAVQLIERSPWPW